MLGEQERVNGIGDQIEVLHRLFLAWLTTML